MLSITSRIRTHYDRHLKTKKHQMLSESEQLVNKSEHLVNKSEQLVNIDETKEESENFPSKYNISCKYCEKKFTTKTSMYRHIRYTCKK